MNRIVCLVALLTTVIVVGSARADVVIFSDSFTGIASPLWGNEVGNWSVAGGVYDAALPNNIPPTYTSLPFDLDDFALDLDVNNVRDGGVWLRSSDNNNGVLLVTNGNTGALYWHVIVGGSLVGGVLNPANVLSAGANIHLHITAAGDTFSVFLNGSGTAATTLVDNTFTSGKVGLYDFSAQTFDNVAITVVPAPIAAAGAVPLLGLLALRRRR